MTLESQEAEVFLAPVISYLTVFLAPPHRAKIDTGEIPAVEVPQTRNHFVSLFVSQCRLVGIPIDMRLLSKIKNRVKSKHALVIKRNKLSEGICRALWKALLFATDVKKLKIGGSGFTNLFSVIEHVIQSNRHITSITIEDYGKNDSDFQNFVRVLPESAVERLVFKNVAYTQKMLSLLMGSVNGMSIKELRFVKCSLGRRWVDMFDDEHLASSIEFPVTSLKIEKDEVLPRPDDVISLSKFLSLSNVTSITLRKVGNDVSRMLTALCEYERPFVDIDLSENPCSADYHGTLNLPNSLRSLKLSHVKWKGNSLVDLFCTQSFSSRCTVDVSAASIEDYDIAAFCEALVNHPEQSFCGLTWNENPISAAFLGKLSERDDLDELSLDKCTFTQSEKKTILGAMASLLETLQLTKLSIRRTFLQFKAGMLESLKTVLSNMHSLRVLDVSSNGFEDEGLLVLEEILKTNTNIQFILFDGCNARKAKSLIQFMNELREMQHINRVGEPRCEIERFRESSKLGIRELIKSWAKLSETLAQRNETVCDFEMELLNSGCNSVVSDSYIQSESMLVNPKHSVTWDIFIEPVAVDESEGWDELETQFSFDNYLAPPPVPA